MLTSSVKVLWTARYDYQPQWRLAKHKHDYFQMIYFASGEGNFYLEEREYSVSPCSLMLIKPGCMHGLKPSSLVKTLDLKFLVKARRLYRSLVRASDCVEDNSAEVTGLFEHIRKEGEEKAYLFRERCDVFLTELLLHYLRQDHKQDQTRAVNDSDREVSGDLVVQQASRYIEQHYAEGCTVRQIANAVGKSDRHIRQHFRECLGISPRTYLLQYRIHKAKELIQYSNYAFKEIADKLGFKTVHHFARVFHEVCGETPGAWRRKYQDGICKDVYIDPQFINTNWIVSEDAMADSSLPQ